MGKGSLGAADGGSTAQKAAVALLGNGTEGEENSIFFLGYLPFQGMFHNAFKEKKGGGGERGEEMKRAKLGKLSS